MRQQKFLAIGVGALLIFGIVGGAGLSGAVATAENPLDIGVQDDDDTGEEEGEQEEGEEEEEEEQVNVSRVQVSAQQAIGIAENETNGTVVALELTTVSLNETEDGEETETENETEAGNETENETLIWEVEFLSQNGTETEVLVDATDGSVLGVQTETAEQEQGEQETETETTTQ